jgi:predicted NAD/FAD-binding protein
MDPVMSASVVKVFPKPISYRMLGNIFYRASEKVLLTSASSPPRHNGGGLCWL